MRDGDEYGLDTAVAGDFRGAAGEFYGGLAGVVGDDFDIVKGNSLDEACAEGFDDGFFSGPASGEADGDVTMLSSVLKFVWCEAAFAEVRAVSFQHGADAGDIDDIGADADDHAGRCGLVHGSGAVFFESSGVSEGLEHEETGFELPEFADAAGGFAEVA